MANRISGITVEINGDATNLKKSLEGVDKNIRNTQNQLKDVEKLLKLDPTNTELLAQKQKLLAKGINETKDRLDSLKIASKEAAKTAGNYDAWKAKYDPLKQKIDETNNKLKDLKEKSKEADKQLANGEISQEKYDALQNEIKSTSDDLKSLQKAAKDVTKEFGYPLSPEQYDALQREVVETEISLKNLEKQANGAGESVKNAGDKAESAGNKAEKSSGGFSKLASSLGKGVAKSAEIGVKAFAGYTGAAAAVGTTVAATSLKTYTGFESAMSQVQATMGIAKDAMSEVNGQTVNTMDSLNALAQKMGAETAFSASECAEALNYLALAGYDTQQMTDTLPTVLNLAAAGGLDLASASDMVTDAMSALGMQTEEADKMVDQMSKTASTTNTSVAQLGEGILTIGATAKDLSGGTAELNTALGILANNGIKGAEGGTHLRNTILSLQTPTNKSAAMMNSLGVAAYDSGGKMRPLNDILGDLNASMDGMTDEDKTDIISTIFNKTDLAAVNSLLANTGDTWTDLQTSIEKSSGAAQQMADTQLDNISGQLTLLQSAAEGAQVALGEKLAPATKEAVVGITEIINAFNSSGLDAAISKLYTFVAQLAETLRTQIPTILPELMTAFNSIVMALVQSIGTLLPPLLDTVLPILVTSFLNLITKLLTYLTNALPSILESVSSAITQILGTITENTPTIINSVMTILQELISFISSNLPMFISAALTLISGFAVGLLNALPDIINAALQLVDGLIDGIIDNLPLLVDTAMQLVQSLCDGLIQNLPEIIQAAVQLVLKLVDGLLQNLPKILKAALQMIQSLIQGLLHCLPNIIQAAIQLVMGLVNGLIQNLPMILQAALKLITGLTNGLLNAIPQLITCAMELITGLASGLVSAIPQLIAAVPQLVMALVNSIMENAWLTLGMSILKAIWDGIFSYYSTMLEAWSNVFSQLFDKVAEWAVNIWNKAKEAISNFWNAIMETLQNLPGEVWNWLSNVISKAANFAIDIGNKATEAATNLFNNLVDGIKGLPERVYSIGSNIVEGLWNGIGDMVGWISDKISGFGDSVLSGLKDFFGIHSPSKVFKEEIGFNLVYGFAEGVDNKVKNAVNAVNSMGQDVMKAAEKSLQLDWNVSGLGNAPKSNSVVNNYYHTDNSRTVNQTNNSPKSLSRLEILRQTKNALKGVVV